MYDLILVDDECFTIDVFAEVINYNELGFNLAGTFYDGRKALEYIKNHHVDAVITDIIMPEFTGVDLLREIRAFNPDIEVIFLSAHADFEYASFGIDNKIFKYVLKPLTMARMQEILTSLHSHLLSKNSANPPITFQNYINPVLQKSLYDYIYKSGALSLKQLQENMTKSGFQYNLESDYMTITDMNLIELDSYLAKNNDFNSDTIIRAIKNLMCRDNYLVCPLIYTFDSFRVLIIAKANSSDDFMETLSDFIASFTHDLATIVNLQVEISSSKIFTNISDLANYNKIYSEASQEATFLMKIIAEKNNKLEIFNKLDSIIRTHGTHKTYMECFAYSFYLQLVTYADQDKIREYDIYPSDVELPLEPDMLNTPGKINHIAEYLPQTVTNLVDLLWSESEYQPSTAQKAIDFIHKNYTSKISLTDVANHVYCNPTYLSRLLKESVGLSFTNYLNKIRVTQSEILLRETNESVYTIAKNVGYESMGYFYKKFKEKNNCSPDSYRHKFKKKQH